MCVNVMPQTGDLTAHHISTPTAAVITTITTPIVADQLSLRAKPWAEHFTVAVPWVAPNNFPL